MARVRKPAAKIISTAVFVLMELTALIMLSYGGPLQRIWISRASYSVMGLLWGASTSIGNYFALSGQNKELAQENFFLQQELRHYKTLAMTARQDSLTANLSFSDEFEYIPATIRKVSKNKQHNYIILNKGSEDGVRPQSGIITSRGVIGIVDAVNRHNSYGITLMNPDMNISARLGSTGAVGPLSWDGISMDRAFLKEIPLQTRYSPGDTVWTSGYSSIFPPDIPLGIAGDAKIVNGAVNEVEVKLFQSFSSLRYVTIVRSTDDEEIVFLEGLESD